jgi:Outer membrane protein beta-barrel domain
MLGSVVLVGLAVSTSARAAEGPLPPLPSSAPEYDAPPPPAPPAAGRRSEWGAQLRLETAAVGHDASPDAGMGGLGFSVRPRLSPHFAIDVGVDFLRGQDFYGEERSETAFFINPMIFVNPRNRVQFYVFGGLGFSGAEVTHLDQTQSRYSYMGFDAGLGLEFRFWRHVAIDCDMLAFVRGRTDDAATYYPEFVDARTGRSTNTSGGALFRVGMTYYW